MATSFVAILMCLLMAVSPAQAQEASSFSLMLTDTVISINGADFALDTDAYLAMEADEQSVLAQFMLTTGGENLFNTTAEITDTQLSFVMEGMSAIASIPLSAYIDLDDEEYAMMSKMMEGYIELLEMALDEEALLAQSPAIEEDLMAIMNRVQGANVTVEHHGETFEAESYTITMGNEDFANLMRYIYVDSDAPLFVALREYYASMFEMAGEDITFEEMIEEFAQLDEQIVMLMEYCENTDMQYQAGTVSVSSLDEYDSTAMELEFEACADAGLFALHIADSYEAIEMTFIYELLDIEGENYDTFSCMLGVSIADVNYDYETEGEPIATYELAGVIEAAFSTVLSEPNEGGETPIEVVVEVTVYEVYDSEYEVMGYFFGGIEGTKTTDGDACAVEGTFRLEFSAEDIEYILSTGYAVTAGGELGIAMPALDMIDVIDGDYEVSEALGEELMSIATADSMKLMKDEGLMGLIGTFTYGLLYDSTSTSVEVTDTDYVSDYEYVFFSTVADAEEMFGYALPIEDAIGGYSIVSVEAARYGYVRAIYVGKSAGGIDMELNVTLYPSEARDYTYAFDESGNLALADEVQLRLYGSNEYGFWSAAWCADGFDIDVSFSDYLPMEELQAVVAELY